MYPKPNSHRLASTFSTFFCLFYELLKSITLKRFNLFFIINPFWDFKIGCNLTSIM